MSNNITIYPNLSDLVSVSILPSDVVDVKGFLEQIKTVLIKCVLFLEKK